MTQTQAQTQAIELLPPVDEADQLAVHDRWKHYMSVAKERDLLPEETREAIICTRILRRTNTGPAKAKETKAKAAKPKINLLDD